MNFVKFDFTAYHDTDQDLDWLHGTGKRKPNEKLLAFFCKCASKNGYVGSCVTMNCVVATFQSIRFAACAPLQYSDRAESIYHASRSVSWCVLGL